MASWQANDLGTLEKRWCTCQSRLAATASWQLLVKAWALRGRRESACGNMRTCRCVLAMSATGYRSSRAALAVHLCWPPCVGSITLLTCARTALLPSPRPSFLGRQMVCLVSPCLHFRLPQQNRARQYDQPHPAGRWAGGRWVSRRAGGRTLTRQVQPACLTGQPWGMQDNVQNVVSPQGVEPWPLSRSEHPHYYGSFLILESDALDHSAIVTNWPEPGGPNCHVSQFCCYRYRQGNFARFFLCLLP